MGYLVTYGYLFICVFILSMFRYYFNIKTEYTRKIMHFLTGFTWFIINHYYFKKIDMIIIPISFIIINYLSYRFKLFNIIERSTKNHLGTIYYAIGITILQILNYFQNDFIIASSVAVVVLSFGDGAASFFGSIISKKNITLIFHKSLVGFISFIIFAYLGCMIYFHIFKITFSYEQISIIVITGAVLELITGGGLDNISILFSVSSIAYLLI